MKNSRHPWRKLHAVASGVFATLVLLILAAFAGQGAAVANPIASLQRGDVVGAISQLGSSGSPIMRSATPAAAVVSTIQPTPAAQQAQGPVTVYVPGTGGGGDSSSKLVDGRTVVMTPYPASIFPGSFMGPYSYKDSVEIGATQAVANAMANDNPVKVYEGHSQGESGAWEAAAKDGVPSVIIGTGTPTNPGTGFVNVMPSNLLLTETGNPSELAPEDTAIMRNKSGDCWGNMPDIRNVLSLIACIPSTIDTHYNNGPGGYSNFHADEVYKTAPNITQEVEYTENGLVLIGMQLNPNMPEDQKQFLRDIAPQGRPGIQSGPTLREIIEEPQKLLEPTPAPLEVASQPEPIAPVVEMVQDQVQTWVDQGTQMVEDFANGGWVNESSAPYVEPSYDSYSALAQQVFEAPVQQIQEVVSTVAPQLAPVVNDVVNQGMAFANTLMGGM